MSAPDITTHDPMTGKRWTVKVAVQVTGGLSNPSKMPGRAWSIPAKRCITGAKLRKQPGSICSICYALKGRYVFKNVQDAQARRLALAEYALDMYNIYAWERWVGAMVFLIRRYAKGYMRWFDSGDLQSLAMLLMILDVVRRTPEVKHWMPTRETRILRQYYSEFVANEGSDKHAWPDNLRVRRSSPMIDGPIPEGGSGAYRKSTGPQQGAFPCDANTRGGECGPCRFCWENDGPVTYPVH